MNAITDAPLAVESENKKTSVPGGPFGLQLFAALIYDGNVEQYRKLGLTEKLFYGTEKPLFSFIDDHAQKHNALPKPETVAKHFGPMPKPVEPIKFYADHVMARYKHKRVNKMLTDCNEPMKAQDTDAAVKLIAEALSDLRADPHYTGQKSFADFVMTAPELMSKKFPPLEMIVAPFLPSGALAMVYAPKSTGKTWFAWELALSVAKGKPFFAWDVPKARRVLCVDGEMPAQYLYHRLGDLCPEPPEFLTFVSKVDMLCEGESLNLHEPKDRARIDEYLASLPAEKTPALIIFDNHSSLAMGKDESDNSALEELLDWFLKLRSRGCAVLLVHHAGKDETKGQRGASRRTDFLNTVIRLKKAEPAHGNGACFEITFENVRGEKPEPLALTVELDTSELVAKWRTSASDAATPAWLQTLRVIRDEEFENQNELAEKIGITKGALSKQLTKARAKGLLHDGELKLTIKGMQLVEEKFPKAIIEDLG
jgi:hypothetical protein